MGSEADLRWCKESLLYLRKQMDAEKLFPPGRLFHMTGSLLEFSSGAAEGFGVGEKGTLKPSRADTFRELRLHVKMFDLRRPLPVRYETVLNRIYTSLN